jgi:hypothetical protein
MKIGPWSRRLITESPSPKGLELRLLSGIECALATLLNHDTKAIPFIS